MNTLDIPEDASRSAEEAAPLRLDWTEHLTSNPEVCSGRLCAKGTRIPVSVILDSLAEGSSRDEILEAYPSLRPEHIDAALAYAAELASEEESLPLR